MYGTTFPQAYHRPVAPNGTADMVMLFACGNGAAGCDYELNYIGVQVQLTAEGLAHAATAHARQAGVAAGHGSGGVRTSEAPDETPLEV